MQTADMSAPFVGQVVDVISPTILTVWAIDRDCSLEAYDVDTTGIDEGELVLCVLSDDGRSIKTIEPATSELRERYSALAIPTDD